MNIEETVNIQAHNPFVAHGRAITEVLKKHVGRRFQNCLIDNWTTTGFNLTSKHRKQLTAADIINCKINLWSRTFINTTTNRVVLTDISAEETEPINWSTKKNGGAQTYTIKVTIVDFPDPEEFIKRVQESNSLTNSGDSVRWHDVLGRTIKGVSKLSPQCVVITEPLAVAKTMFIGEVFSQDFIEEKVERNFVIDDYTWAYAE